MISDKSYPRMGGRDSVGYTVLSNLRTAAAFSAAAGRLNHDGFAEHGHTHLGRNAVVQHELLSAKDGPGQMDGRVVFFFLRARGWGCWLFIPWFLTHECWEHNPVNDVPVIIMFTRRMVTIPQLFLSYGWFMALSIHIGSNPQTYSIDIESCKEIIGNGNMHGGGKSTWKDMNHSFLGLNCVQPMATCTLNLDDYQATDLVVSSCFVPRKVCICLQFLILSRHVWLFDLLWLSVGKRLGEDKNVRQ